ncbi:hypothetical protein ABIC63_000498 [Pseudacidovorax sp. 1753]|uniref:hypothetical protein n=1 Tax=Pseudacidovorax sp. 1753 TaxID=3156419 RepID=UPI0033922FFC
MTGAALGHPTLLRVPAWYSDQVQDEIILPLAPEEYDIAPGDGINARWVVTSSSGAVVYNGIGPVTVLRSPAPF